MCKDMNEAVRVLGPFFTLFPPVLPTFLISLLSFWPHIWSKTARQEAVSR